MLCCANSSTDTGPTTMNNKMKLLPEASSTEDPEDHATAVINDEKSPENNDTEMTHPKVVPPPSVKMAGYLEKRGKRFLTWKQYWFVLDGHLLMYFRNQFEYLNSLSPCRGTINLGLVSGVRPAGSRSSPQLELLSRSQTVHLRAKERKTQERWLQAILDAMQMQPASGTSTFRYTNASLPKTTPNRNEEETEEEEIATQNVLQRIKTIGGQSQASLVAELRTKGAGSLRHVSSPKSQPRVKNSPQRGAEITAQLPTNKAVLRLLERRQEEEDEHVTTIVVDPAKSPLPEVSKEPQDVTEKTDVPGVSDEVPSADDLEVLNDGYVATEQIKAEMTEEDDELYEKVPAIEVPTPDGEEEDVDYDTMGPVEEPSYEPSVPPRRSLDQKIVENIKPKEEEQIEKKEKDCVAPTSNIITRKRSFLQRMLGRNKNKKVPTQEPGQIIPKINVDFAEEEEEKKEEVEEETDDYETVDYEELIKNRIENEKKMLENSNEELKDCGKELNTKNYVNIDAMTNGSIINSEDKIRIELKSETTKTVNTMTCNTEPMQELTSNIVPIVENEKTHTVTITVHNSEEIDRPKLPPRRPSSGDSIGIARSASPCHDVPTNNGPVIAKTKRRSSEYIYTAVPVSLVSDLEHEDSDLHKTIINIPSEDSNTLMKQETFESVISTTTLTEQICQEDECKDCSRVDSELFENLQVRRCSHKHHSADELDILLQELTHITNSPLHSSSVDTLEPLRKHRTGEDPDYDIPRPHQLYMTLRRSYDERNQEETLEATRFFNEPELHYARPLSEYLQELERMSNQQQKRSTRASNAFQKWIAESQKNAVILLPSVAEDVLDSASEKSPTSSQESGMSTDVGSTDVPESFKDETTEEEPTQVETQESRFDPIIEGICVNPAKPQTTEDNLQVDICEEKQQEAKETGLNNPQEELETTTNLQESSKIEQESEKIAIIVKEIETNIKEENEENNNETSEETAVNVEKISDTKTDSDIMEQNNNATNDTPEQVSSIVAVEKISDNESTNDSVEQNNNETNISLEQVDEVEKVSDGKSNEKQNINESPENFENEKHSENMTNAENNNNEIELLQNIEDTDKEGATSDTVDAQTTEITESNEVELPQNTECQTANKEVGSPTYSEVEVPQSMRCEDKITVEPVVTQIAMITEYSEIQEETQTLEVTEESSEELNFNIKNKNEEHNAVDQLQSTEKLEFDTNPVADEEVKPLAFKYLPLSLEPLTSPIEIEVTESENVADSSETTGVELRTSERTQNAVRLSYAMAEAEIVIEETVDTIKTPYTSSIFSYPTTDQGIPPDSA